MHGMEYTHLKAEYNRIKIKIIEKHKTQMQIITNKADHF